MVALLQFAVTWVRFDISYTVGQLAQTAQWHFFVLQKDLRILQHFIILWRISRSTRASSWMIKTARRSPQVSMGFVMWTEERARAVD